MFVNVSVYTAGLSFECFIKEHRWEMPEPLGEPIGPSRF